MGSVEVFVVFAMAAFNLAVVPWREDTDELVPDTEIVKRFLKESGAHCFRAVHPVSELRAVVRLDALNGEGKLLHAMTDKLGGRIGAVLFEGFEIAKAAVFVNEGELVVAAVELRFADKAGDGDELYVDLYPLTGILHLLVWLGDIFRIWQLYRHLSALLKEAIQTGNGSLIAALPELYPEYHQPGVGVSAPHVVYELDLFGTVLVWMTVWAVRAILQRLQRAVIAFHPTVNVLPVCPVPYCRCRDAVFLCVVN